jgi:hypothetical protein
LLPRGVLSDFLTQLLCLLALLLLGSQCCSNIDHIICFTDVHCAPLLLLLLLLLLPSLQPGPPFTVDKTGPSDLVKPGDAFSYNIAVKFTEATTGVTITDDLPVGLLPGSTAATWTATSSVAVNPATGGEASSCICMCCLSRSFLHAALDCLVCISLNAFCVPPMHKILE